MSSNIDGQADEKVRSISRRVWDDARKSPWFLIGATLTTLLVVGAIVWPEVSSVSAFKINIGDRNLPPWFFNESMWIHPLGTDQLGRDLLVRCFLGLRVSLLVSVTATILMFAIGCTVGLWSGYKSGKTDTFLMRLTDVQLSIPAVILAIVILGLAEPSIPLIILVLALAGWPVYARVVRAITLNLRNAEYVRAARVVGASNLRIVVLLIAANILPSLAFVAILDVAKLMIFESILSFLGLGIQPPTPSFGAMIADGRQYMINAWWLATMPGVFLFLVLLGLNFIGVSFERARERVYGGVS